MVRRIPRHMRSEFQCTPATAVRLFAAQLLDEPVAAQARTGHWTDNAKQAFTQHWPEYMIEGVCLGLFMISACAFSALLEHPASPVRASVMNADVRRFMVGLAMGMTAILLIYSPMGRRSGAHMNPATTLTFYRLGKVERWDAAFYMLSQFVGGVLGVLVSFALMGATLAHRNVNFAITRPGRARRRGRVCQRSLDHLPVNDGHFKCFEQPQVCAVSPASPPEPW